MSRATVRKIFLPALVLWIVGVILLVISMQGAQQVTTQSGTTGVTPGNGLLSGIGILLIAVGGILNFIAWIGALIGTAQLGRWVWFIVVLLLGALGMLIYVLAGPTERREAAPTPTA